jgi:predicted ArsR family transcriptional regulator
MRTAVATTSLDAYSSFSTTDLQRKEREVMAEFAACHGLTVTREQLAERLGWKEAAVCGRANSLVAKKVLEEIDGGKTRSGRPAKLLRVPVKGQGALFQ